MRFSFSEQRVATKAPHGLQSLYLGQGFAVAMAAATRSKSFPELKTERLVLRAVTLNDAAWYFRHFNTDEIVDGQMHAGPKDMKQARREVRTYFISNFAKGTGLRWGISLKGSSELIGSAGLYLWKKETGQAEAGYDLNPNYWKKGIMTEAMTAIIQYGFERMALNRIELLIDPKNRNSLSLARRLGFKREGILREHYIYKGQLLDDCLMSLLKREWKPRK